ncbi:MAG: gas vesicle protein GvpG [Candidatus Rokubacteria bacterium]|nr:gas vesicle protein GvpG [Candidatus Rokubacteria bacterium]
MFLIDDFLLWVVEQVHDAAQEEMAGEADAITEELRQLYMRLEAGQITELEFDEQEQKLLDRLDAIRAREEGGDDEAGEEKVEDVEEPGDGEEGDVFGTYAEEENPDADDE